MPTPPWYGHLLRGITEVRRKPGTAARGSYRLAIAWSQTPPCMLHAKQRTARSIVDSAVYLPLASSPVARAWLNLRSAGKNLHAQVECSQALCEPEFDSGKNPQKYRSQVASLAGDLCFFLAKPNLKGSEKHLDTNAAT
jgi:hypothetical protein